MNNNLKLNKKTPFSCRFSDFVWMIELFFAFSALAAIICIALKSFITLHPVIEMLLLIAAAAVIFFAAKFINARSSLLSPMLLLAFAVFTQMLAVIAIDAQPISDFSLMYSSAVSTLNGDLSWTGTEYFQRWAYQIPFVLYEALVLSVSNSMRALQLMNVFFAVGCIWLVYMLAALYLEQSKAVFVGFMYALCPSAVILTPVLTNQHISLFFTLLGIYVYLASLKKRGKDRYIPAAAAGVLIAVGNLMRAEAVVVILSIIFCTAIYYCCRRRDIKSILPVAVLTLAYFALQLAVGKILALCGAAPYGISNNVPQWKFIVGLDFVAGGTYTERNIHIFSITDNAERWRETISAIKQSHAEGMSIRALIANKISCFWDANEQLYFVFTGSSTDVLGVDLAMFSERFDQYSRAYRMCLYALAAAAAVKMFLCRRREFSLAVRLMTTVVCVFFVVFLLIEIRSRYRYVVNPFMVLMASALLLRAKPDDQANQA